MVKVKTGRKKIYQTSEIETCLNCVLSRSVAHRIHFFKLKRTIKREVQYKTLRSLTAKTKGARKEPEKSQKQYFGDSFRSTEPIFLKFGTNLY